MYRRTLSLFDYMVTKNLIRLQTVSLASLDHILEKDFQMLLAVTEGEMSLVVRKPVFVVSDLVRHKPGCAVTDEISDLGSRGIVLSL